MNRDTPAGKASVKHLCEVFGVSRQAYHKALQTPAIAPELPPVRRQSRWLTAEEASNAIRPLAEAHPSWGVRKIWACLSVGTDAGCPDSPPFVKNIWPGP